MHGNKFSRVILIQCTRAATRNKDSRLAQVHLTQKEDGGTESISGHCQKITCHPLECAD